MIVFRSYSHFSRIAFAAQMLSFALSPCAYGDEKKKNIAVIDMPYAIETGKGFSFQSGVIPIFDEVRDKYVLPLDLMWDYKGVGLIANHVDNGPGFSGHARMVDLGKIKLDEARKDPTDKGKIALVPQKGHTYCVRFANNNGYGFIHVMDCNLTDGKLVFSWKVVPPK